MDKLGRAFQFFRPDAKRLLAVGALMLLSIGANLLKPWPLAVIVDSVLGDKPVPGWLQSAFGSLNKESLLLALATAVVSRRKPSGV